MKITITFVLLFSKVEEVQINVPWGHIAGKWYGPKHVRPVLALHGWQDNAGTFDHLIPLLPAHLSYLAIDLPGHGLSSRIPNGQLYSSLHIIHCINLIRSHYKWEKLSLMSHSFSSINSFRYASCFPNNCDMVIGMEYLKPLQKSTEERMQWMLMTTNAFAAIDERNQQNKQPHSYTYDELAERWVNGTGSSVTGEAAKVLMKRSTAATPEDPNKFYFTRDSRLKVFDFGVTTHEMCLEMAKRIKIPYLFLKGSRSPYDEDKKYFDEVLEVMLKNNALFQWDMIDGTHHFPLTSPAKISAQISEFLLKHRPNK